MKKQKICLVIPVRLNSDRFPKKILKIYNGKPILKHIIDIAKRVQQILGTDIIIASNSKNEEIIKIIGEEELFYMDDNLYPNLTCGSERIKYIANEKPGYTHYISIPADEPSINPEELIKSIENVLEREEENTIYTLWTHFYNEYDLEDYKSCKVVLDQKDNVIYTSRSIIPGSKIGRHNLSIYRKHVGVFIFTDDVLLNNIWGNEEIASREGLEQNMFIGKTFYFKAVEIKHNGFGVDSPEQIEELEKRFIKK